MKNIADAFPLVVCGSLIVLGVLLVIVGHRQGDANAIAAATATALAPTRTPNVQLTTTPVAKPTTAS
jgi:hypothetical protein